MYDLNDAQPQILPTGDPIPDGTFARIRMTIRPGGVDGSVPMDKGLLKASTTSDAKMLDCEFTVLEGPFAKRKFWQNFTVAGGKVDEKGVSKGWNISKAAFRASRQRARPRSSRRQRGGEAETGDPGTEAARRHRVRRTHHDRAGIEPAIQGRQQTRQRRAAGRTAVRGDHAWRAGCAGSGQRQAAQGGRDPGTGCPRLGSTNPARRADIRPVGRAIGAAARQARRPGLAQHLTAEDAVRRLDAGGASPPMTRDQWQAHVTREAAKAIGQWLEGRGRLHQPIAALTMAELEAMAANAISRFVVLGSQRIRDCPEDSENLSRLLLG